MASELPTVHVLGAITPSVDSARAETLEYENLHEAAERHASFEYARIEKFWSAEEGSLKELEAASQLAMQYMLMGSLALMDSKNPGVWSRRFTQSSSELYGVPDADEAQRLWDEQQADVKREAPFQGAALQMKEYFNDRYASVYSVLEADLSSEPIPPHEVADRFEDAIATLAVDHTRLWRRWRVERSEERDSLSAVPDHRKIIVGLRRAHMQPHLMRALFSHEVLVHGARGINGRRISRELGKGLPGYLDAEEGLGVFVEYALNGKESEKNIDRYIDTAYALGHIDGKEHTRQELLDHVMRRALRRIEKAGGAENEEDIEKAVYAHVNRIYRGTLGNEHVGVFTKDISYYKGFMSMGAYIQNQLDGGATIDEVVTNLFSGKFDPTNPLHASYVEQVRTAATD